VGLGYTAARRFYEFLEAALMRQGVTGGISN
jgi:hypothetical protein